MQAFKKSVENRLDANRVRIRQVAEPVLERIRKLNAYGGDAANQRIKAQTAEVEYENAKLMREVAQIAVKEYEQGNYVSDLATAKGRVRIAEAEVQRAAESVSNLLPLFMQNKKAATWSVAEKIAVANFETTFHLAELQKKKAEFELEQAKAQLEVLNIYEKPKRLMELKVQVEKALSEEFAKRQMAQLQRDKLSTMKKQAEGPQIPAKLTAIMAPLADAVRLDGEIRRKLATLEPKGSEGQAGLRKEVEDLASSLEANVNTAVRLFDDLRFSELSSEINFISNRAASGVAAPSLERRLSLFRKIPPEDRPKLKTGTQEEQTRILKKAGFTDAEIQEMQSTREKIQRAERHD
jgi:hypothetical protein